MFEESLAVANATVALRQASYESEFSRRHGATAGLLVLFSSIMIILTIIAYGLQSYGETVLPANCGNLIARTSLYTFIYIWCIMLVVMNLFKLSQRVSNVL